METLLNLRKALGLTQQQMADRLGVRRVKYAKVELGYQKPDVAFIAAACQAFNLKPDDMYRIFFRPDVSTTERTEASTHEDHSPNTNSHRDGQRQRDS